MRVWAPEVRSDTHSLTVLVLFGLDHDASSFLCSWLEADKCHISLVKVYPLFCYRTIKNVNWPCSESTTSRIEFHRTYATSPQPYSWRQPALPKVEDGAGSRWHSMHLQECPSRLLARLIQKGEFLCRLLNIRLEIFGVDSNGKILW